MTQYNFTATHTNDVCRHEHQGNRLRRMLAEAWKYGCSQSFICRIEQLIQKRWRLREDKN